MFRQVNAKIEPLTREFVESFNSLPTSAGERDREGRKGKMRVAWLRDKIENKLWMTPTWATAELDGVVYRINGGHSSLMLSQLDELPAEESGGCGVVFVQEFECDTPTDLADLFDQFDPGNSLRRFIDKIKARGVTIREIEDLSATRINHILPGVAFVVFNMAEGRHIVDDETRLHLMAEHADFIKWCDPLVAKQWLRRSAVVGAIFATYGHAHENPDRTNLFEVEDFWYAVMNETAEQGHPTRVLASFLKQTHGNKGAFARWPNRAFYVKCIHAWNAAKEDRTTDLKYTSTAPIPKLL